MDWQLNYLTITLLTVAGLGLLALIYSYGKARSEHPKKSQLRWVLFLLRTTAIALAAYIVLAPSKSSYLEEDKPVEIAVLVDTSKSMAFKDGDDTSRFDEARDAIASLNQQFGTRATTRLYAFGETLRPIDDLPDQPLDNDSDIESAIKDVSSFENAADLGGIVLLSDGGISNQKETTQFNSLRHLGIPVFSIPFGKVTEAPDIKVNRVTLRQPVPYQRDVRLSIDFESYGFEGQKATLSVLQEDISIFETDLSLKGGLQNRTVQFPALQKGYQVYEVKIQPVSGERLADNNSIRKSISITDKKIRVLYMEGSIPETFVLPSEVTKDPQIEMDSFFATQRGGGTDDYKMQDKIQQGKKVIYNLTHPTKGLAKTREGILGYDVIILSDILKDVFTDTQIDAMVELVEREGGGFVMVGGITAFGAGRYDETVIDRILPVEIKESRDTEWTSFKAKFPAEVLADHPILKLTDSDQETEKALLAMPDFQGLNLVDRPKPGATLIASHPYRKNRHGPIVVFAVQQIGNGRSMAFTPDCTPAWGTGFQERWGTFDDRRKYYRAFWNNSIRWLAASRINRKEIPFEIEFPDKNYIKQSTEVFITALQKNTPLDTYLRVTKADGSRSSVPIERTSDPKTFRALVPAIDDAGGVTLSLKSESTQGTKFYKEHLEILPDSRETQSTVARPDNLQTIAEVTEGKLLSLASLEDWSKNYQPPQGKVFFFQEISLWDRWWLMVSILGELAIEWLLRRLWGFA